MKVLYIYRHPDMGFSIGKVFRPIEKEMSQHAEVDSIYLPFANYSIKGLYHNIRCVQKALKEKAYDLIHITGGEHYLIPFINNTKTIVTVHDFESILKKKSTRLAKLYLFIKVLRHADMVTFISKSTEEESFKYVRLNKTKYTTIHNPVGEEFIYKPRELNTEEPVILHIGTKENKNLNNTIIALSGIKSHLRIIGKLTNKQISLLKQYNINHSNTYNLTDDELLDEYYNCDIVNFPSLYEGFGMPIIEGQAVGRVVITSDISPMTEVANNSAILVDPYDPISIKLGFQEAIKRNNEFINKGLENVKRFNVKTITNNYYSIYKEITSLI